MGCLKGTMYNILHNKLGLVKKSARLVSKLLSEEQKKERVKICTDFVASMHGLSMTMLDNIVIMDETWYPTTHLKKKRQSKQWIKKGLLGLVKAKVLTSGTKQMVLAFIYSKGLVYMHHPQGHHDLC
jgi:hypothetical protein